MNRTLRNIKNGSYVMYSFLLIQTVVFIYTQFFGMLEYGSGESYGILLRVGSMYPALVAGDFAGNWFRFITPIFVHIGLMHFVMNSIMLYFFGDLVESIYGHFRFAMIYLLSGILGNVISFSFSDGSLSAGASTSLFGLFGAFVILKRYFPYNPMISQLSQQYIVLIVVNILMDLFIPQIDLFGHIGGLIGGVLASIAFAVPKQAKNYNVHERIISGILFLFLLIVGVVYGLQRLNGIL